MNLIMCFIVFPIILSALAWRPGRLLQIACLYITYLVATVIAAYIFAVGFGVIGHNVYAFLALLVLEMVYYTMLLIIAIRNEESIFHRLMYKADPYMNYCWDKKWLWLHNAHFSIAVVAAAMLEMAIISIEYWMDFDYVLDRYPVRGYTAGVRFLKIVTDFIVRMTNEASFYVSTAIGEFADMEWR